MSKDATHKALLRAAGLHKHYRMGSQDLHILRGVNLSIKGGEWVAIEGASGSGKSTLLHLLGGLDRPDQGHVQFADEDLFSGGSGNLDRYRTSEVGFVFQFYHLLPELNALENVLIAAMVKRSAFGWPAARRPMRRRAAELLDGMGLSGRLRHKPNKLSGGERQRVAIARALINEPPLLLADEPTGNLDTETGAHLLEVFARFHQAGQTIIMVTHDEKVARIAQRRLELVGGRIRG